MSTYLRALGASIAASFALVALCNLLVDPYGVWGTPPIEGVSVTKPAMRTRTRLSKAYAVGRMAPRAIILGSSRVDRGLDPEHPGWQRRPVYNLGLDAVTLDEALAYLEHAHAAGGLEQVVFGLDFFTFNESWAGRARLRPGRLLRTGDSWMTYVPRLEPMTLLFSIDTLRASIRTVRYQGKIGFDVFTLPNGQWSVPRQDEWTRKSGGQWRLFERSTVSWLERVWLPPPSSRFDLAEPGSSGFETFVSLLDFSRRERIDLRLFFSPMHAWFLESLDAAGLWPAFETWKRHVTTALAEEAGRAGAEPFPLWDFATYGDFTTEAVPAPDDRETLLRFFQDGAHYTSDLGNHILDHVLEVRHEGSGARTPFGARLDPDVLGEHFERIRAARSLYREARPDESAWVRRRALEVRRSLDEKTASPIGRARALSASRRAPSRRAG